MPVPNDRIAPIRIFRVFLPVLLMTLSAASSAQDCALSALRTFAPFPVGVAVKLNPLAADAQYRTLVGTEFSTITAEEAMKPSVTQPARGEFDFSRIEFLADHCRKHNQKLHGHTLVWHKENPAWLEKAVRKGEGELLLKAHVEGIVSYCREKVASWDVVNEAFNDDGSFRESFWFRALGPDYLRLAFAAAASADPDALLFYNDYDLESRPEKLDAVLAHLLALRNSGVKVDGIGLQMHIDLGYPAASQISEAVRKITAAGFRVHFSEVDISTIRSGTLQGRKKLERQAKRIEEIVTVFLEVPADLRHGITFWGLADHHSWLSEMNGNNKPLLLDAHYRPKPVYCRLAELLKTR